MHETKLRLIPCPHCSCDLNTYERFELICPTTPNGHELPYDGFVNPKAADSYCRIRCPKCGMRSKHGVDALSAMIRWNKGMVENNA